MATTDAAAAAHSVILPWLFERVYGEGTWCSIMERLASDGLLQVDRLYEMFEAQQWNSRVVSGHGSDLENGMECKLRSTFLIEGSSATFLERTATANKTGDIILGVVNRETMTFDRFLLPKGTGYNPGKTKRITWNRKQGNYGINEQWKITSDKLGGRHE